MPIHYDTEVPIPLGTKLFKETNPRYTGRTIVVDVHYDHGRQVRKRIGVVSDHEGFMNPNEQYYEYYGGDYLDYTSSKDDVHDEDDAHDKDEVRDKEIALIQNALSVGLFIMVLCITDKLGIYDLLIQSHGVQFAHALLDYICYLLRYSENSVSKQTCQMSDQILFTNPLYSDSWYSNFFNNKKVLNMNSYFLELWIKQVIASGITDVLLCIDGSNIDCEAVKNEDAERGYDKSGQHTTIISFMWVVVASGKHKGMPIAYITYNGSQVDCAAFSEIAARLSGYGLKVAGFILDRGFCTEPVMKAILGLNIDYIIMMTEKTGGFVTMYENYGDSIKMSFHHLIDGNLFAVSDYVKVFKTYDLNSYIGLYYDPVAATNQSMALMNDVRDTVKDIEKAINEGKKYSIPKRYKDYIIVKKNEETGQDTVSVDTEKLDKACAKFGFSGIASSANKSAEQISEEYDLRQSSELGFRYFKTPLGAGVARGHNNISATSRMFPAFLGVIIYNEFQHLCKSLNMNASEAITKLDRVQYVSSNRSYVFSNNYGREIRRLLRALGVDDQSLRKYATIVNQRYNGEVNRDTASILTVPYRTGFTPDRLVKSESSGEEHGKASWTFSLNSPKENDDSDLSSQEIGISPENATETHQALTEEVDIADDTSDPPSLDERNVILLSSGRKTSKEEREARKIDLQLGDLITIKEHDEEDDQSAIIRRKPGRPKGSKDSSPRKRRTNAELGKESKRASRTRNTDNKNHVRKKPGRPKGSKDSYQRVRRTKKELTIPE